jgi:hypothetical protein
VPLLSGRTPARAAALWAFVLHVFAALWVWWRWGSGVRGGLLFWMDFPLSLAYAGARGAVVLLASLALGGAWWALLAAGLARLVGSAAHTDARDAIGPAD